MCDLVDVRVPGVVASCLGDGLHAAGKTFGERMAFFLFDEHAKGDAGRVVGATVRDADDLGAFAAQAQLFKDVLLENRFERSPDYGFFIPRAHSDGHSRRRNWLGIHLLTSLFPYQELTSW